MTPLFDRSRAAPAALLALAVWLSGCAAAGWMAEGIAGGPRPTDVEAEYTGLRNQRVAVLVSAGMSTMYQHPLAQFQIAEIVARRLAGNVPEVRVLKARDTIDFQERNIYWSTVPFSELAERLNVDRIVLIELIEYRLHEPGNVNIWRGSLSASVSVAEADGPTPNDLAYSTNVTVSYPPDAELGVVKADERTMRLGLLDRFGRAAAGKFYDHQVEAEE